MNGAGPPEFSIATEPRDDALLVTLAGELDLANADDVESAVLGAVAGGRRVVLDLRQLDFMDSSGVRVLVAAHAAAEEGGGRFTIVRPPPGGAVSRVLEISGLEGILELVDSADV